MSILKLPVSFQSHEHASSLDASAREGIWTHIMTVVTDYYLIPLALFMGAGVKEVGLLVALPNLLASIAVVYSNRLLGWVGSRKSFVVRGVYLQAAVLVPAAFLCFWEIPGRIWILITLIIFFRVIGNLVGTVWGSLISDYLKPEERGRYFGWRFRVIGVAGIAGMIGGGIALYFLKKISPEFAFFTVFFAIACMRFRAAAWLARMNDLPLVIKEESDFTFWQFVSKFRESNFVRFVFYIAFVLFAAYLSSPYMSVHMIQNLGFDYLTYMCVHMGAVIAGLIAFPLWGRHADLAGNAKVLKITGFFIAFIPILWILFKNPFALILVEFTAGFFWGGFNLCTANYIFDAVSPEKRVRCLSYFNLINGIALCLGGVLGGYLAEHMNPLWGYRLYAVFLLSALCRLLFYVLLSGKFREVRAKTGAVSSADLIFSVVGIRPIRDRDVEWVIWPPVHTSSLDSKPSARRAV